MPFKIETQEDELLFRAYTAHRDAVRSIMGHGVYPNLVKALETYVAFDAALANGLSDPDLLEYHASAMQVVAPQRSKRRTVGAGKVMSTRRARTASCSPAPTRTA